jgi:bacterioferritin-associated ferredoxin
VPSPPGPGSPSFRGKSGALTAARPLSLDTLLLKTIFNFKMYVCLCEAVTDHDIRTAVEDGASSVAEVMLCTRAGTRCGSCRTELAETVAAAQPSSCRRRLEVLDAFPHRTVRAA